MKALLLIHVVIALISIIFTTFVILFPSASRLLISYLLVGGTLISGTALVWQSDAVILDSCIAGFTYTGFITVLISVARHRFIHKTAGM